MAGIQRLRSGEGFDRLVNLPIRGEDYTEVEVIVGMMRIERDRRAEKFDGIAALRPRLSQDRERIEHVGRIGMGGQYLAIKALGFIQTAGLLEFHGLAKEEVDRLGWHGGESVRQS